MWLLAVAALLLGACSPAADNPASDQPRTAATPSTVQNPTTTTTTTTTTTITTTTTTTPSPTRTVSPTVVEDYRPGLEANVYRPASSQSAPVVVMVPGGGWRTADPSGYAGLAASLATAGMLAVTVEIGAAEDGAVYPAPVDDIHCAIAYAAAQAATGGSEPGPVIVLGHSSGAHLAALAALDSRPHPPGCPHPPARADALVGLAGVYDVDRLPALAYLLFAATPEEDPEKWEEGNPILRAALRPGLPALLLHGASDALVPVSFSQDFAAALEAGGHDTTLRIIPRADHGEIILAEFSGGVIADWVTDLDPGSG